MIQGSLLKKYREENNLEIKDLSKLMHVSKNVIMLWEDGSKIPREDDVIFLCSLYGIDRLDLIKTKEKEKGKERRKIKDTKYRNILISAIILIIVILLGFILKSRILSIVLSLSLLIIYNSLYYMKDERALSKNNSGPKTIFGISIPHKEKITLVKYYLLESLTIASLYLLFSIITYELNIEPFVISAIVFSNEELNMLFIWGTLFTALTALILALEIVFASILMKKKGDNFYG